MLIFERSKAGRGTDVIKDLDVEEYKLPQDFLRKEEARLPEVAETDVSRHYSDLAKKTRGVNDGIYPLGSCTMKYNPRLNEAVASMKQFSQIHPLQSEDTTQGELEVMYLAQKYLCDIAGMDQFTLQPAAGAHGEFCGLLTIKSYHEKRGDVKRDKILIPDSAHGTNPASATMAGYKVIEVKSDKYGNVDIEDLKRVCGDDTAGLMLTNPNTVGIFDENIEEITEIIHSCGGLCYYDGANLNAIVGQVKPGDMGFDVVHLNLHKTFSTPHGGGGPGSGPVGCKKELEEFLPGFVIEKEDDKYHFVKEDSSFGELTGFYGNFAVVLRALVYILSNGKDGLKKVSQNAVLNANYMRHLLEDTYDIAFDRTCMHEFIINAERLKNETGISAMDIAKGLIDRGIHPPTMYFPLTVEEALMIEPTETESKESLDNTVNAFKEIFEEAHTNPQKLHDAPITTVVGRLDEVEAARNPIVRYTFPED
ncbi:MAG: aminomethyl-transferring glycine dehydrogenase subunit GcvPB [Peptoniphilaceae bacterium]|nr:aminomethyl-transferring glycine dehydrogenase subunit GcvPB [Peptoniphilaceae bacterium]MDY3737603.1 aminomethyl-transferring glycine dehydrogenase subunit GcvPB [Peptoniphilaceae bacterium]